MIQFLMSSGSVSWQESFLNVSRRDIPGRLQGPEAQFVLLQLVLPWLDDDGFATDGFTVTTDVK